MHPWPNEVRVGWLCHCPGIVWEPIWNELTHNSSENTQPQPSQLAEPLWTNPGVNSGISVCELISILKKKARAGNKWSNILSKILASKEKATTILAKTCCSSGVGVNSTLTKTTSNYHQTQWPPNQWDPTWFRRGSLTGIQQALNKSAKPSPQ